jgi:uncharacterized protein (TIGR03546 family)
MILWLIRLVMTLRKALAGRRHPRAMAAGIAFGLLLGLVPKLNLTAVLLLGVTLCLNLNHAVCLLTAIGVSFLAARLDPWTGALGAAVLESPRLRETWIGWYEMPLVPWMKLHNTVVLGSLLSGSAAVGPVYFLTVPWLKRWAARQPLPVPASAPMKNTCVQPRMSDASRSASPTSARGSAISARPSKVMPPAVPPSIARIDPPHPVAGIDPIGIATGGFPTGPAPTVDPASQSATAQPSALHVVDTQIDLVRLVKPVAEIRAAGGRSTAAPNPASPLETPTADSSSVGGAAAEPGHDALRFLVRHVMAQRQGKAA